jgi:hypothetical protein
MRKLACLLPAGAVMGAGASTASALLVHLTLATVVRQGDLIVVAEVTETQAAARLTLNVPGYSKPLETWFRKYGLRISRVITENGKVPPSKAAAMPANRTIEVFARSLPPPRPDQPAILLPGMYFPTLRVGKSYVLILRKMAGKPEYYLPSHPKNYRPGGKEEIALVERVAVVDKWPWGRAVDGLRLALVPEEATVTQQQVRRSARGKGRRMQTVFQGRSATVRCQIALRNASDAPVGIALYRWDRFLSVTMTDPNGKAVKADLYGPPARGTIAPFRQGDVAVVNPGEVVFIGPRGKSRQSVSLKLDTSAGTWKMQASLASKRGRAPDQKRLWTGVIESAAVKIEVKKARN